MNALMILTAGFGATTVVSEFVVRSGTVQAVLGRVAFVQVIGLISVITALVATGGISVVSVLIFWSGAYLTWFGVRSHLESSILLRFIYFLGSGPAAGPDLVSRYESFYGLAQRQRELFRAGLIAITDQSTTKLTRKGAAVASVVLRLRQG